MCLLSGVIYFGSASNNGSLLVPILKYAYIWEAHLVSELYSVCYQSQEKFL